MKHAALIALARQVRATADELRAADLDERRDLVVSTAAALDDMHRALQRDIVMHPGDDEPHEQLDLEVVIEASAAARWPQRTIDREETRS